MLERYDSLQDSAAAEYVPLARAAAMAHARLYPDERARDTKCLDLLGLALSARLRLYTRDMKSGALHALDEADLARGRFTRGATRLEFAGRDPVRFLLVARHELHAAIESVVGDERLRALLPAGAAGGGVRPRP